MDAQTALTDDHVFLIGRPPLSEFLGFIRTMSVDGQSADQGQLASEWRRANDHVITLENTEANIADGATITPLSPELTELAREIARDSSFQGSFSLLPTEFGIVELDQLVVYQKFINLRYVQELKNTLPSEPTSLDYAQFTLGIGRLPVSFQQMQNSLNTYTFSSASKDFRFLEGVLVGPQQVSLPRTNGRPVAYLCLAVGIEAGFDCVAVVAPDEKRLGKAEKAMRLALSAVELGKTHFFTPDTLFAFVEQLDAEDASKETTVRGYKVKVNYKTVDRIAKVDRTAVISKVLADTLTKPRANE